jgi:hypothetical protein
VRGLAVGLGLLALGLGGCGDDGGGDAGPADGGLWDAFGDDFPPPPAIARFELPGSGPIGWDAIPFPHDLFLGSDGTVELADLPGDGSMWDSVREELDRRDGFCTTCGAWFPIDGALDPASLPPDAAPDDVASAADPIVLLDTEDATFVPLRREWNPSAGLVVVEPARGHVLRSGHTYIAALTSALRGANGTPLQAAPLFAAVRDGESGGGTEADRARPIVRPALDALVAAGVDRTTVVAAAVFTTWDPTADARAVREIVHGAPAPAVAAVDRVIDAAELDELLGTPAEPLPGAPMPAAGTDGTQAIQHDAFSLAVVGRFSAPRVLERDGLLSGYPRRDADGAIEAGPSHEVPFLLVIPDGADVTSLPVVLFHHGLTGTMDGGFFVAEAAARAGAALVSIEPFLHGSRSDGATDAGNGLRGTDVPDGFLVHPSNGVVVPSRVLGILDVEPGREGSPLYPAGAWLQMASDAIALSRLLREGDVSVLAAADPALSGLAFDPDRVLLIGASQGSLVGSLVAAVDDAFAAAVLNVPPGSVGHFLCNSPRVGAVLEMLGVLTTLGIRERFDGVDRRLCFHPSMKVYQWAVEIADPLAFAPALFGEGAPARRPDVMVQLGGHDELAGVVGGQSYVAAAGLPGAGTFDLAPVAAASLPVRANRTTPSGAVTAGAFIHPGANHLMLALYEEEAMFAPPLDEPFMPLAAPMPMPNPVVDVHRQLLHFYRTRFEDGRAEICDPAGGCPAW